MGVLFALAHRPFGPFRRGESEKHLMIDAGPGLAWAEKELTIRVRDKVFVTSCITKFGQPASFALAA